MSLLCTIAENPSKPLQKIDFHSQYKEYNRLPCVSHLDDGRRCGKPSFVEIFRRDNLWQINCQTTSLFVKHKS